MADADIYIKGSPDTKDVAFLVLDTESIPDGRLLQLTKYAGQNVTAEEAVTKAQEEARAASTTGSDFLPVSFHYPISVCVARVGHDFRLQQVTCLDSPSFRPREITEQFWRGAARYNRAKLVTFNGRGFDLPLLELAAFRYGCSALDYFQKSRNRFNGHLDLLDWLTNYGGYRLAGGLNLLAKILGKPGKMDVAGDQVYGMYLGAKLQEINDYCLSDTLDAPISSSSARASDRRPVAATGTRPGGRGQGMDREACRRNAGSCARYLASWREWEPWP